MYTLRYLIFVLLFSAVATSATAHSAQAVDGYQLSSDTVCFAVGSQELESDEPDALLHTANLATAPQAVSRIGSPHARAIAFYYGDYQPRAPPKLL